MKQNTIYFLPLGGSDEIGMNLNLYCYNNRWLMVDVGVSFAPNNVSDISMPSLEGWLKKYPNAIHNLDGVLITHAHEDHYGAVAHLWEQLSVNKKLKIYTTPFTAELLRDKFKDKFGDSSILPIETHEINEDYQVGQYKIRSVYMTHSTVEQMAFAIEFPNKQSILHTGDWKIDTSPITGKLTNIDKLKNIGNILAIVGDSTNAQDEKASVSEEQIGKDLLEYVDSLQDRVVIVAHFASNLARMQSCINIAKKTNRMLLICGRSMHRFYNTGIKFKYIQPIDDTYLVGYIDNNSIVHTQKIDKNRRILVMATGSQGEENAFLSRLVDGNIKRDTGIELSKNTTLIFSSRNIPGNEIAISKLTNKFIKLGVKIKTGIHASGHPGRPDLKLLYNLVKPKFVIPVHGEPIHIAAHKEFAESLGIESVFTSNGQLLEISNRIYLFDKIEISKYYLYGNELIPCNSEIFARREQIRIGGMLRVSIKFIQNTYKASIFIKQIALFDEQSNLFKDFLNQVKTSIYELINMKNVTISNIRKSRAYVIGSINEILTKFFPYSKAYIEVDIHENTISR